MFLLEPASHFLYKLQKLKFSILGNHEKYLSKKNFNPARMNNPNFFIRNDLDPGIKS
jgi:hypothetical protein